MADNQLTDSKVGKLLDWAYEKSINGIPGSDTSYELAENFMAKHDSIDKAINSLVRWQNTKSATSGFLTGLGGLITLPVAIPANIASVTYVQIRMIAAIAHMRGFDLKDDQVKTFVFVCLTGQSASDILKQAGIKAGTALTKQAIKTIPGEIIKSINKAVGFRLVTKFGEKGVVNLGKAVPLVGGFIGGTVDGIGTNIIGKTAKKVFI
ncbi:EcsC family protein [Aquibacillus sp. 3ASR75-11]|uniref:EcsC family protein n=1 Tax=Terrihalobacillus insolitus TaxID=2950438 RepID=A0A9X4AM66_9BACI|nr:EcsC family protein [Terrihalobacillus insolitus]MDC3413829.1 EcsC family protein [Terrihalobacillus insolitus]MDC3424524.1 EcsC family protein [Terrihalobacillus insolitus]